MCIISIQSYTNIFWTKCSQNLTFLSASTCFSRRQRDSKMWSRPLLHPNIALLCFLSGIIHKNQSVKVGNMLTLWMFFKNRVYLFSIFIDTKNLSCNISCITSLSFLYHLCTVVIYYSVHHMSYKTYRYRYVHMYYISISINEIENNRCSDTRMSKILQIFLYNLRDSWLHWFSRWLSIFEQTPLIHFISQNVLFKKFIWDQQKFDF